MGISRAKPRKLDLMANMTGVHPLLLDFSYNRKETSAQLHVNFSNVKKVNSIGLAIFLGLLFLGKKQPENYEVKLIWSKSDSVNQRLHKLGIVALLDTLRLENNKGATIDLFDDSIALSEPQTLLADCNIFNANKLQRVILFYPRLHTTRQEALDSFSRSLKNFMEQESPRTFNHEQIIKVFIELAKNTYDHSYGFGVAGLLISSGKNKAKTIEFVYCDTGEGICQNVRDFLATTSVLKDLAKKGGSMDILYKAFEAGFSTKFGNGVNHGMGLTLVTQGAAGCGFNVWLRDAESIVDLSGIKEPYTHAKLRNKFTRTTASRLLMFHFEREM